MIPDFESGKRIIEHHSTQNCSEAFLLNGDNLKGYPTFRSYGCDHKINARYFIETTQYAEVIERNTSEIRCLNEQMVGLRNEIKDIEAKIKENDRLKSQNSAYLTKLGRDGLKFQSELRNANAIEVKGPVDLQLFEVEIERFTVLINQDEESIVEIEETSSEKKAEFDNAKLEKENIEMGQKQYVDKIKDVLKENVEIESRREEKSEDVKHYKKQLSDQLEKERPIDLDIEKEREEFGKVFV